MKFMLLVALALVAHSAARPSDDIVDFELDDHEQEQEGQAGRAVKGEYSWTAPDGNEYFVKYEADRFGYRVVEDNVVPKAPEAEHPEFEDD
ncbi:cuticle protein CP575-like [Macrobrachium rosenbergii]|uniref:cuticle protein CP575-like n=1 Tax=Macrobrachium rosenbergii TaxID=79674 RepID=UPI0034D70ECD